MVTNTVAFIIHSARIDHGRFVKFRQIHIRLPALNIGLLTLEVTLIMRKANRKPQFVVVKGVAVNTGDFRRYIIPFLNGCIVQGFGHKRIALTRLLQWLRRYNVNGCSQTTTGEFGFSRFIHFQGAYAFRR